MQSLNSKKQRVRVVSRLARDVDALLTRLVAARHRSVPQVARLAARLVQRRVWLHAGFARADDFARERFGRSGRWLLDLAALGNHSDVFPSLERALTGADGHRPIGTVAALAIGHHMMKRGRAARGGVATQASAAVTEGELPSARNDMMTRHPGEPDREGSQLAMWIARARTCTVRELRRAMKEAASGEVPGAESSGAGSAEAAADSVPTDGVERVQVRVHVPREVRNAFEEVRDLHEALAGGRATGETFVESLLGEIASSGMPAPASAEVSSSPVAREQREHSGRRPNHADDVPAVEPVGRSPATCKAIEVMRALNDCERRMSTAPEDSETGDSPAALLDLFAEHIALQESAERCIGALLVELEDLSPWQELGYVDLGHYAETCLGMAPSTARERATLARRLQRLPQVRAAYEAGSLRLEAAKLVARLSNRRKTNFDAQRRWIDAASEITVKRLRDELRVIQRRPPAAPREPLDDATWFASLSRAPGRSRDRVLHAGFDLIRRIQRSEMRRAPVDTDVFVRVSLPQPSARDLIAGIEACRQALEALSQEVEQAPDASPALEVRQLPSLRLARVFAERGLRIPSWLGLLAWLEEVVLVWDEPAGMPRRPAQRVYVRDGWRCMAPGCTSRQNLENHHVKYRSRGGGDSMDNRVTLCRFHHQWGEHGGRMRVRGKAPLGLRWRLGSGPMATAYSNERRLDPVCSP